MSDPLQEWNDWIESMGGVPMGELETVAQGLATLAKLNADRIEELEAAIVELEPYTDAIVCYASTISEHDANRVVRLFRDLKTDISETGASNNE